MTAKAFATALLSHDGTVWQWRVHACPFCGAAHTHGGGPGTGDPKAYLGSRVAHCNTAAGGVYTLVEGDEG